MVVVMSAIKNFIKIFGLIILGIFFILALISSAINLYEDFGGKPIGYTIQDVYVYCCKHLDVEITAYGDNCTQVIHNIYGGVCYAN